MKTLSTVVLLLSINSAFATMNCQEPKGDYTTKDMVINQFALDNATPNWGDWCYEVYSQSESSACNEELNQWDLWINCSNNQFETSCKNWADKEGFATTKKEYQDFIKTCVKANYSTLLK